MKKHRTTIGAVIIGMIAVLGVGAQTVYATTYTSTEVSAHNTASDCWEVIDGKVYNLTAFIAQHSGGQSAIRNQCGKDASAVFHSGPHSASAITALAQYQVGTVGSTPPPTTPPVVTTPSTPTTGTNTTSTPTDTTVTATTPNVSSSHDQDDDDGIESDDDEDGYPHQEREREHVRSSQNDDEDGEHLSRDGDRSGRDHDEDD